MKKVYFDAVLFDKISEMATIDVFIALDMCKNYIEEYPKDYRTYPKYASLLIKVGRFDEAEKMLDLVEKRFVNTNNYGEERGRKFVINYIFNKLKLLMYQGKYEEFLGMAYANKRILEDSNNYLGNAVLYGRTQLGINISISSLGDHYLLNQIKNYSEDDFFEHVKKHEAKYRLDDETNTTSIFYEDFPLKEIVGIISGTLPNDKMSCPGFFENEYFFKYDNCGRCFSDKNFHTGDENEKNQKSRSMITDYFKVVTFKNTNQLITMCPCPTTQGFPTVDINYLKSHDKVMIKRKSKIDKFNEKYNL